MLGDAPEKRPILVGLAFGFAALVIALRWPAEGRLAIWWAASIIAAAGCLLLYEQRLRVQRRPVRAIRWVAFILVALALVLYALTTD